MNKIKTMLIILVAGTVTFTAGLWLYSTQAELSNLEYAVAALVLVVVIASLAVGFRKLKDAKQGIPAEDELSLQVKQKAAAVAFAGSFYIWTMILLFMPEEDISPTIPIGVGIMLSGLLFFGLWAYYSKQGLGNGDTN